MYKLSTEEVKERTDITIKMANAVGESTEKISDQLTAVWNNFADGTQTLEHYADAMTKLGAYTASSTDEIAQGTEKFAAVAKMIGLDFDNAAAALATVTAQTRQSADVVGTAFRTIFARMEGLKLGETLEDGTDLNQYSQALAKVGINIKDQNGQLKDMTLLINEIGNRWQQISRDQQVALAQTVAGVRQYSQFAALFENFDYYQELVDVAKNSTGELTKQAQIYGESWAAASKRVRASAEGIYKALLNEDFFIDFDNGLASFLSGVEKAVDAIGGLKGIIITLGATFMGIYQQKMVQGLRDWASNVTISMGIAQDENIKFLRNMNTAMTEYANSSDMSEAQKANYEYASKINNLKLDLAEKNDQISEQQREQINNQIEYLKNLQAIIVKQKESVELAYSKTATAHEDIDSSEEFYGSWRTREKDRLKNDGRYKKGSDAYNKRLQEINKENRNAFLPIDSSNEYYQKVGSGLTTATAWDKKNPTLETVKTGYNELKQSEGILKTAKIQWDAIAKSSASAREKATQYTNVLKNANKNIGELTGITDLLDESTDNFEAAEKQLNTFTKQSEEASKTYRENFIKNYTTGSDEAEAAIDNLGNSALDAGGKVQIASYNAEDFGQRIQNTGQQIEASSQKMNDWANKVFMAGQALMGIVTLFQSFSNLSNIIKDEDVSVWEKYIQVISALAPIMMSLTMITKALNTEKVKERTITIAEIIQKKLEVILSARVAAGKMTEAAATKVLESATWKLVIAQIAAKAASPLGIILLITAAIGGLIAVMSSLNKSNTQLIEKIEKNNQKYEEEHQKLVELNDELKTTQDRIKELENQDSLTFVEQTELTKLKTQNDLLERQVALQKEKDKIEAEKTLKENVEIAKKFKLKENQDNIGDTYYTGILDNDRSNRVYKYYSQDEFENFYNSTQESLQKSMEFYKQNNDDKWKIFETRIKLNQEAYKNALEYYENYNLNLYNNTENIESLLTMETNYLDYLTNEGIDKDNVDLEILRKKILEWRDSIYSNGEQWEIYIKPILDREEFDGVKENIYSALINGEEFSSDMISDDLEKALLAAGYTVEDFSEKTQSIVTSAKDNLTEVFNVIKGEAWQSSQEELKQYNDILNELDPSVLERLSTIDPSTLTKKLGNQEVTVQNLTDAINELSIKSGTLDDLYIKIGKLFGIEDDEKRARIKSRKIFDEMGLNVDAQQKIAPYFNAENIKTVDETASSVRMIEQSVQEEVSRAATEAMYNDAKSTATNISGVLSTIVKDGYDKISDTQKATLRSLEQTYPELSRIVDKSSKEYQEKLHDIQETQEKAALKYQGELVQKAALKIDFNSDDIEKQLDNYQKELDNYSLTIQLDVETDLDYIQNKMDSVADAIALIGEKGQVSAKDIEELANAFPGILENYQIVGNGMIQLDQEIMNSSINTAKKDIESDKEKIKTKLENYATYYDALAEADQVQLEEFKRIQVQEINADSKASDVKKSIDDALNTHKAATQKASADLQEQLNVDVANNEKDTLDDRTDNNEKSVKNNVQLTVNGEQQKVKAMGAATRIMIENLKTVQQAQTAMLSGESVEKYIRQVKMSVAGLKVDRKQLNQGLEDLKASTANTEESETTKNLRKALEDAIKNGDGITPDVKKALEEEIKDLEASVKSNRDKASIFRIKAASIMASTVDPNKTGSSSSKSESAKEAKEAKEYLDMVDNFADVNAALEKYAKLLERTNNELEDADNANKADIYKKMASNNKKQIEEAQKGLAIAQDDIDNVTAKIKEKTNLDVVFDPETGDVLNMTQIQGALQLAVAAEKSALDSRKADLDSRKETLDKQKENKDAGYESNLKTYQDDLEKYDQDKNAYENFYDNIQNLLDGAVDNWKDYTDKIHEFTRDYNENMANALLAEIEYRDEISDEKKNWNDFVKSYFEEFDDILHYGPYIAQKSGDNATLEIENIKRYREDLEKITSNEFMTEKQKQEAIANLRSKIRDSVQNFYSEVDNIQDIILNTLQDVQERFDKITEDIQRRNSRINSYQEILTLQGYDSVRSKEGRALYNQAANTRLTNLRSEYDIEQQNSAMLLAQKQSIEDKLANLTINTDADKFIQSSLKKQLEEIENSYQDSQDRMVEITQESLTLIKEMYNNTLDQQLYDYEQNLTGGLGFDQLQTNIDYNFEAEERYLDMVNEEYAVKEYGRKLDKAINDSQNKYAAEQYENLRDEMEQRRANGKLSQYDLDLMNSKLEVTKAQMALEEAQNAKSTVRLVRNSAGNWDYQFTADQNKIDEAQANYDKAVNDSYNLAKNYYKTNMQNIIALRQQTYSQIEQIVKDETLTESQKEEAIKKIREQALEKYAYIMSEMKIAQKDMSEFGKATTDDYYNVFKGVTEGLDLSYKTFEESFDKNTDKMKQTFYQYGMQIDKTSREAGMDVNSIQKNIENLTTATDTWKTTTKNALDEIYSQKGQIDEMTESLARYNEQMAEAGGIELANRTTTYEPTNDKMARIQEANNVEAAVYWNNERNKYIQENNLDTRMFTEQEIRQAYEDESIDLLEQAIAEYKKENPDDDKIYNYLYRRNNKIQLLGKYKNEQMIITKEQLGKYIKEKGLATGGYTGEFSGARLAFLHEKELVLNKTDTQNILSAVAAVRELAPALLEKIGQSLNGQILAGRSLMESRMSIYKPSFSTEAQPLEQNVIIQADFPGVSAAVEIEAALNNLINDATQYASVVRG